MADEPILTRVYLTLDPLTLGEVPEVWAKIEGDVAIYGPYAYRATGEGRTWHRSRSAAESYARQLQVCRLDTLRAEILRLEGLRFGRLGP